MNSFDNVARLASDTLYRTEPIQSLSKEALRALLGLFQVLREGEFTEGGFDPYRYFEDIVFDLTELYPFLTESEATRIVRAVWEADELLTHGTGL
jgi:hypothetical protein